jgi:hypothetical protein
MNRWHAGLLVALLASFLGSGFRSDVFAANLGQEFCVANSPDGTLSLRRQPSTAAAVKLTLYNGDCGVFIVSKPARSGVFVRVSVGGDKGWMKAKWLVPLAEFSKVEGTVPPSLDSPAESAPVTLMKPYSDIICRFPNGQRTVAYVQNTSDCPGGSVYVGHYDTKLTCGANNYNVPAVNGESCTSAGFPELGQTESPSRSTTSGGSSSAGSGAGRSGCEWVSGYTRKNGTRVSGYRRCY